MDSYSYSQASATEITALADVYAASFATHPAYNAVFFDLKSDTRQGALRWLFEGRVRMLLDCGNYFLVARDAQGTVVGAAGLVHPDRRPSMTTMLRHGLGQWACLWGLPILVRVLQLNDRLAAGVVASHLQGSSSKKPQVWEVYGSCATRYSKPWYWGPAHGPDP